VADVLMETETEREPQSDLPDEVLMVARAMRRIGYGLLVSAIVLDVVSVQVAGVRKFFGAQWASFADEVLPNDRPVLDLALAILGVSDVTA
jgi:hypothetical protein